MDVDAKEQQQTTAATLSGHYFFFPAYAATAADAAVGEMAAVTDVATVLEMTAAHGLFYFSYSVATDSDAAITAAMDADANKHFQRIISNGGCFSSSLLLWLSAFFWLVLFLLLFFFQFFC